MTRTRRRLLWFVPIAVVVAGASVVLLRFQGILVPVRIASGSMAEQLLGPHRLVTCSDCGFTFRCGSDTNAPLQLATCPNCGFGRNDLYQAPQLKGDRVLIDRWAYARRSPQRGDIAAFVDPSNENELAVKRVVGLPSEAISIRDGEILVNGQLHRKSLATAKRTATLVHDDSFRPKSDRELPQRWRSDEPATAWKPTDNGHVWEPAPDKLGPDKQVLSDDWLRYHHWRCYASPRPRTEESPVADNFAYNQGVSRELREVTDLLLSCNVTLAREGEFSLSVHDGREEFIATISAGDRRIAVQRGENTLLMPVTIPNEISFKAARIEFGVIDYQVLLSIADVPLIRHAYSPLVQPQQTTPRPFGIAGRTGACLIENLQVYRDIHYLNSHHGDWPWHRPHPASDTTFIMLGDNPPISRDSRHWSKAGLTRDRLIGKVLSSR